MRLSRPSAAPRGWLVKRRVGKLRAQISAARRNAADALWQEADRMAAVSEVAAFQVGATADPGRPVRIQLWDASQFCVWEDPDDPARMRGDFC